MERLSDTAIDIINRLHTERLDYNSEYVPLIDGAQRLAAYEDTGMEPEAVEHLKLASMGKAIAEIKEFDGLPIDRLRELARADKDGRCVVLPCKQGDTLWTFRTYPNRAVYKFKVTDLSALNGRTMLNTDIISVIDARDVGKTVFLTREEAEAALEGMKK